MRVERLSKERVHEFVAYCKKHKAVVDESFLYDEDLRNFEPNEENPTYIVTDKDGKLVACASLIVDDYAKRGRKGRFRIFHSEIDDSDCYKLLLEGILKHTNGLDKIFVFVPMENKLLEWAIESINFIAERYAFLLVRGNVKVPDFTLPVDYEIKPYRLGVDEEAWCTVRNAGFAKLRGSETPVTPEMLRKTMASDGYIEDATMILYHKEQPIGVIKGADDEYEESPIMDIGPIAIIPEYQGKGLGRMLLRKMLSLAKEKGYKQVEAVTCYKYDLV